MDFSNSTLELYWIVFKEVYFHVLVGFYDVLTYSPIITHCTVFGTVLGSYRIRIHKDVHVHDKLYWKITYIHWNIEIFILESYLLVLRNLQLTFSYTDLYTYTLYWLTLVLRNIVNPS